MTISDVGERADLGKWLVHWPDLLDSRLRNPDINTALWCLPKEGPTLCHPQSLGVDWFFQKPGGWATRSTLLPTWLGLDALSSFVKGAGQCWLLQKLTPVSKSKEENTDSWPRSHEPPQLCGLAHCQSATGRTYGQTQRQGGLDTRANQKKSFPERTRRDS